MEGNAMAKQTSKRNGKVEQKHWEELFVLSRGEDGSPRGARFSEFNDDLVTAAFFRNCSVIYPASERFQRPAKQLPFGTFKDGEIAIHPIPLELFNRLSSILADNEDTSATHKLGKVEVPPDTPLPENWDEVEAGTTVLIHEDPADGWYAAVVIQKKGDVLRLQLKDYPKLPTYERRISEVGLMNPNPLPHP